MVEAGSEGKQGLFYHDSGVRAPGGSQTQVGQRRLGVSGCREGWERPFTGGGLGKHCTVSFSGGCFQGGEKGASWTLNEGQLLLSR